MSDASSAGRGARGRVLRQLLASGPGRVGVALLLVLTAISAAVVVGYPADFGPARWANPAVWADHPKAVPPAWIDLFTHADHARHQVREAAAPAAAQPPGDASVQRYQLRFDHDADEPPTFLSVSLREVVFHDRPPSVTVTLHRPDGHEAVLYRRVLAGPRPGEQPPYHRHVTEPLRVALSAEPQATDGAVALLSRAHGLQADREQVAARLEAVLFGQVGADGRLTPLRGTYLLEARVTASHPDDDVALVRGVLGGAVFGLIGTDAVGRDLAEGLLFGLPVALLIGLAASTLSTSVGATLGLVSGYVGGWVDTAVQRVADIVVNVPVLPLLIFAAFVFGPRLWLILLMLVAFGWPGLAIVTRSMVLQLRASQEVEAAVALGASRSRVITRHVFPHIAPFTFAQLIFFAPSAILAEAGLSFLGLGDPSIPTWGQILEHGFRTGAVYLGYWWWVVPPGLLIILTAVTFMLLSLGMEPVVDPRLRRVRLGRPRR